MSGRTVLARDEQRKVTDVGHRVGVAPSTQLAHATTGVAAPAGLGTTGELATSAGRMVLLEGT